MNNNNSQNSLKFLPTTTNPKIPTVVLERERKMAQDLVNAYEDIKTKQNLNPLNLKISDQKGRLLDEVVSPPSPTGQTEKERYDYYTDSKHIFGSSGLSRNDTPEP